MATILDYSFSVCNEVGERLKRGEVGIFPCDTIYGLCAKANDSNAERIYQIKRRPQSKSFIQLMTKEQVLASSLIVPSDLIDRWPAPFSAVVFDKNSSKTVAIRVPSDEFLQEVLPISGAIFSTSVNFSGYPSLQDSDQIIDSFSSLVDFIVVKRNLERGESSTLIDATKKPYHIIRQGSYHFD